MPTISVTRVFEFHAAHCLPWHRGICRNVHGHTYKVEIEISAPIQAGRPVQGYFEILNEGTRQTNSGMLMDFGDLDEFVKSHVLDQFDHSDLNDVMSTVITRRTTQPTAEVIAIEIAESLMPELSNLIRVTVWETPKSQATWRKT